MTKLTNAAARTILSAKLAMFDGGSLKFYTGSSPANTETAATGNLVGTVTFAATAFTLNAASNGADVVATAAAITRDNAADNDGPVGYYRAVTSGGTDFDQGLVDMARPFTVTIASPGVFTSAGHGYANGTPIKLETTGALPTGLTAGTTYYVVSAATDTFQLAATAGGSAIATTGSQSGTHKATRQDADLLLIDTNIKQGEPIEISSMVVTKALVNG